MNTLTYRCLADYRTYVMTCNDELLDLYMKLMFENDVYKVNLNDEVEFTSYADYEAWKKENKVGNNINTLTYRCLADYRTYVMTCSDDLLDLYMKLMFENDVYKVNLNDKVVFTSYSDYELWKNAK